jgi:KDO2-lipid IV(A) lauroyltransferase
MRYVIDSVRKGRQICLGLIADQSPRAGDKPNWVTFFGQQTDFYIGPEKIAVRFKMPVYFVHIRKCARARYSVCFEMIYDGVETVTEGEITQRYAARLEDMIREAPWLWMWSHRRWKKKHFKTEK